jgi:hypothetical protein
MSVCPSVRTKQLRSQRTNFPEVFIFSAAFLWDIFHSNKNSARCYHKRTLEFVRSIAGYGCQIVTKRILEKLSNKNISNVCPVWSRFVLCDEWTDMEKEGQTDGQTGMKKIIAVLSNSAKSLKNY